MQAKALRDVLFDILYEEMKLRDDVIIVSADFGAPSLDKIRESFPSRFINVGIAEQNMLNISVGLALEGFKVYAYGIAPFVSMRCYEQIRNASIQFSFRPFSLNIVGVGAGASYSLSGPSHFAFEDVMIMDLPYIEIFSPSDESVLKSFFPKTLGYGIRYLRFDAKALPHIAECSNSDVERGFRIFYLSDEARSAIVSTGYMVHVALSTAASCVIDVFSLNSFDYEALSGLLERFEKIIFCGEFFLGFLEHFCKLFGGNFSFCGIKKDKAWITADRSKVLLVNNLDPESLNRILE